MRWLLLVAIGLGAGLAPWQRRPSKAIQVAFWQTVRGYEFLCGQPGRRDSEMFLNIPFGR